MDNTLIRGQVQLHKTEAVDEPSSVESDKENTFLRFLSGAVFELYEDANGNKELDAEDTLVGALKETDGGFRMAEDLLAKRLFRKRKESAGGLPACNQKAYYFSITEEGQTVVIENGEAGHGDLPMRHTAAT